jgi:hypothetical protein
VPLATEHRSWRAASGSFCSRTIPASLTPDESERKLMLAHLRYDETFVKRDGAWRFAERNLYVDWIETKPSHR